MKRLRARDEMIFSSDIARTVGGLKFPKPERIKSTRYLDFVRRHPCVICFRPGPNEAHHLSFIEGTGQGTKPSDLYAIPLCVDHHRAIHATSPEKEYFAIVCCRLLSEWIINKGIEKRWQNEMANEHGQRGHGEAF